MSCHRSVQPVLVNSNQLTQSPVPSVQDYSPSAAAVAAEKFIPPPVASLVEEYILLAAVKEMYIPPTVASEEYIPLAANEMGEYMPFPLSAAWPFSSVGKLSPTEQVETYFYVRCSSGYCCLTNICMNWYQDQYPNLYHCDKVSFPSNISNIKKYCSSGIFFYF